MPGRIRAKKLFLLPRRRELLVRLLALAAVIVMTAGAIRWRAGVFPELNMIFRDPDARPYADYADLVHNRLAALRLSAAGGVLILAASILSRRFPDLAIRPKRGLNPARTQWFLVALGAAALFVFAEVNGQWLGTYAVSSHVQFGLMCTGIALVVGGMSGVRLAWPRLRRPQDAAAAQPISAEDPPSSPVPNHGVNERSSRREVVVEVASVMIIMMLGLLLRVWKLNDTIRVFVDELNFADGVRAFWYTHDVRLLTPISGTVAFPRLYTYWQNEAVTVLGRTLAALRMPSAILGTLTILALYLLVRAFFDRLTAIIAALLLATFPPHVHFSRIGLNNIADPLFGTLAFAFLGWGLRSNRRRDYALAGGALGLTQYFYEGGRLLFPLLMLLWLGISLVLWRQHPPLRGLLIVVLVAVIVAMPVYYTLLTLDLPLAARMNNEGFKWDYWENLLSFSSKHSADGVSVKTHLQLFRDQLLVYIQMPEASVYYGGDTPLVLVFLVPLLLLGTVIALVRSRMGGLLPVLWIVSAAFGNTFLPKQPVSPRYVVAFPALMLVCAIGLRYTLLLMLQGVRLPHLPSGLGAGVDSGRRGDLWRALAAPGYRWVLLAVAIILAGLQTEYYFGPHLDRFNVQIRASTPCPDGEDALLRAAHFPPGTTIYLISDPPFSQFYAQGVADYLADGLIVQTLTPAEVTPEWIVSHSFQMNQAYFIDFNAAKLLELFFTYSPFGSLELSPYGIPLKEQYVLYYVSYPGVMDFDRP